MNTNKEARWKGAGMVLDKLCKDNVICCDDNCQRCANLIYQKYIEQKAEIVRLQKSNRNWRRKVQRLRVKVEMEADNERKME